MPFVFEIEEYCPERNYIDYFSKFFLKSKDLLRKICQGKETEG